MKESDIRDLKKALGMLSGVLFLSMVLALPAWFMLFGL